MNENRVRLSGSQPGPGSAFRIFFLLAAGAISSASSAGRQAVSPARPESGLIIGDGRGRLQLRLDFTARSAIVGLTVGGAEVPLGPRGVVSGFRQGADLFDTSGGMPLPFVSLEGGQVTVANIAVGPPGLGVRETWTFRPEAAAVVWRIEREYAAGGLLDEVLLPAWEFRSITDWTSALLGTGGVAWFKLFDGAGATYGVHTDKVTLWSRDRADALRITARPEGGRHAAVRFSRLPGDGLAMVWAVTADEATPHYDPGTNRRRFLADRDDVWAPVRTAPGRVAVEYRLSVVDADEEYGRGTLVGFREPSIRALANTAARLGVIDRRIHGSNSWRTPYGPAVLHEPFIAALGLLIDDEDYWNAYRETLDYFRDNAIAPDGRVKSRWAYTCEDARAGTCDERGFYETQWGVLLDSNTDQVTNVAELFDVNGDRAWLAGHKDACERALEYLLRRDSDGDGLVEMLTENHREARGSDWLDVIWAAWENAFVNAKLYYALTLWAEAEDLLGDPARSLRFRETAARLKAGFNQPTTRGGLWSEANRWYVHWRDRDDSIHGDNLVTYVNLMAVAYGLADNPGRRDAILDRIEAERRKEGLFFWPVCVFSYAKGEGVDWQFPFPSYENGDIFLALGDVGVRAYAATRPDTAVALVRSLLDRYERDGLAFQRYLRITQEGAGDDILANNAMAVVGLYRDIYGLRPKHDRLYLEPHLTPGLAGTVLAYRLRGRRYTLKLNMERATVETEGRALTAPAPFAYARAGRGLAFYPSEKGPAELSVIPQAETRLSLSIEDWPSEGDGPRVWMLGLQEESEVAFRVAGLKPLSLYDLKVDGASAAVVGSDGAGQGTFALTLGGSRGSRFELRKRNGRP